MLLKIIPVTRKLTQHELFGITGYTWLPHNLELKQYQFSDIPELVYGLEETRMPFINEQNFTGVCEDYQEWFLNEACSYYV